MAGKIKGITIELDGNTTKLEKALSNSEKSIKSVKSELREVEKALKLDPKNTELLAQKQSLLAEQVRSTAEKLKILKDAQSQVQEQYESGKINGEQYRAYQREVVNTENSLRDLRNSMAASNTETSKLHKVTESVKEKFKKASEVVKKFAQISKELATVTLKTLQTSLKAVSKEVEIGMKAFKAYVTGLTTATTAIGAFAVKSGASFEQSMSKVQALSGATGDDLKALEDKAREMGASTSKSASEAADALGYMALAGWNNQQMLEGLEPILRASEAGEMDLATCSDLVTDSMSAMGIQTSELTHYLDVVTKTQSSANTSMQGMLEAYIGCGGTLKNLEVPLEESATLIGVLANRGIKGSEAGTSLNSVLVNLMGSGGQAAKALEALGVSMYDVDGNRKGVTTTLRELDEALKNCSESERDVFTAHIGGKTQMDTLQALLSGLNEEYGDLNGKLQDVDGTLINTAKTMQENFNGAVTAAKSAIEGLGITIFDTFKSDLTETIRTATGFISRISEGIEKGNILAVIHSITGEISNMLSESMSEMSGKVSKGTAVFNSIIKSIVTIIAKTLPGATKTILPALIRGLTGLINDLVSLLPALVPAIVNAAVVLFSGLLDGMKQVADRLSNMLPIIVDSIVIFIVDSLPQMFETGIEILLSLVEGIIESLPSLIEGAKSCIMSIVETIVENLPEILDMGIQILLALIDGIVDMLPELISQAVDLIITIADTIIDNLDEIIDSAVEIIFAICDALMDNLDKIIDATIEIVVAILEAVIDNLDKITEAAIKILITLGSALVDCAARCIDYIPELIGKIKEAFTDYDWADLGSRIMNSIFDGIKDMAGKAKDMLSSAGEHIIDALGFHPDGTFSIPFFADGGTLTNGSAIVGEAGPELLSVSNGRAVVTPLTNNNTVPSVNSPTYNITNIVKVDKISNDYDIKRINERLAFEQKQQLAAVGR